MPACPAAHRGVGQSARFNLKHEARAFIPCGRKAINTLLQRTKARASVPGAVASMDTCPVGHRASGRRSHDPPQPVIDQRRAPPTCPAQPEIHAPYERSGFGLRCMAQASAVRADCIEHALRPVRRIAAMMRSTRTPEGTPPPPRSCNRLVIKEWIGRS